MYDFIIAICGHGDTKDQTVYCLAQCFERLPYKFTVKFIKDDALIGRSRSVVATQFLKENTSDYMIFIDTDMAFSPEELERIYLAMRAGFEVVGGSYALGSGKAFAVHAFGGKILMDGDVHPCKYVSTGFFGITKKALETVRDKCPYNWWDYDKGEMVQQVGLPLLHKKNYTECYPFFESGALIPEEIYISEDWDFCNKVRRSGLTVYLHTGVMVDHIKEHTITAESVIPFISTPPLPVDVGSGIIVDLAEFLGKPITETREEVLNYQLREKTVDDVGWLYELAQFNCFDYYTNERLKPLERYTGHTILDYGCGIGTACLYLCGSNKVVGYDINPKSVAFAKYRANKHAQRVGFTDEEPDLSLFDTIIFIDVLEHIVDLEGFLKRLGSLVKSGTRVYHFDAFFDHFTPGHIDHSEKFDDYVKAAGFVIFDNHWLVKI